MTTIGHRGHVMSRYSGTRYCVCEPLERSLLPYCPDRVRGVTDISTVLAAHLRGTTSSFSIGSYGAIAEFHQSDDDAVALGAVDSLSVATERGAIDITLVDGVRPVAYETLSKRTDCWQHGVAFCLPTAQASSRERRVLTELGPDVLAVRPADRQSILFDLGLRAANVDFCIRSADPMLLAKLRAATGYSVFDRDNTIVHDVITASPHRVVVSALGRVEVFQAIATDRTPDGPHTHVLPKLLAGRRTHSANVPIPRGYLPCLNLHPASPVFDRFGVRKPFDRASWEVFDKLLNVWGLPDYNAEKVRVMAALNQSRDPKLMARPPTRLARTARRIALRQAQHLSGRIEA